MIPDDIGDLYHLYENPEVTRYMDNIFKDKDEECAYIESYYRVVYCFYGFGMWLITKKDGTVIGRAGIEANDREEIVIGYMLAPQYQKQGYAKEACEGVLAYAKEILGIDRKDIVAYIHEENKPSMRLAEKLGIRIKKDA